MLVLSLKQGDKIQIGRDIQISLVELHSGRIRLGIDAPEKYQILRDTLKDQGSSSKTKTLENDD